MTETADTETADDAPGRETEGRPRLRRSRLLSRVEALAPRRFASEPDGPPADDEGLSPLVPPHSVARRSLLALVAIMSALACLSVAGVSMISDRAREWQRQISDEVTIQVRPEDGGDVGRRVARAVEISLQSPGIRSAVPLSDQDAAALLEPWLGRDFDPGELPIPRLIAVGVTDGADLTALGRRLREEVPGASLDDHAMWLQRLSAMANVTMMVGFGVIGLVLAATALSMVFATRGAMAGNRDVIAVLHFVGADDAYIAGEFQRHFLILGLKGAGIGGAAAMGVFALAGLAGRLEGPTPEAAQLRTLLGGMSLGPPAYLGAIVTVVLIAVLIAVTARITVRRTLLSGVE